jgi:zinc/manganese transport system permease protein
VSVLTLVASIDWHQVVNFDNYGELLPLVRNSLIAGAFLGLVGGLVSVFVIARDLPFAVHGVSELSFAGASGALLLGVSVVAGSFAGSLLAALALGFLGLRARDRNSSIGVLMPFGLGLGILFLALYQGRAANKFGLLTGQIVAIDDTSLGVLLATSTLVVLVLATIWRPLMFASVDPEVAAARGVPAGALSVVGSAVGVRVVRLLEPPDPLPAAARWTALAAAGLLLLLPTALLLLPAAL